MADDLDAVRGDTNLYDGTVTRDGAPLPLDGCTLKLTVKRNELDVDADSVFQLVAGEGITITNAANGLYAVEIEPALTLGLPERAFHYDVQLTEPAGRVTTIVTGLLRLAGDVTLA
jgi:hypothetical protein